jgi:hypothetical protein
MYGCGGWWSQRQFIEEHLGQRGSRTGLNTGHHRATEDVVSSNASVVSTWIDTNILGHFEPGPGPAHAGPAHEPYWTGVGKDLEARKIFFCLSPARNAVFSCFTL